MQVLYPRCAGLDVHKDTVVACVRCVAPPMHRETRSFPTTTSGLLALGAWLGAHDCSHVAMEATGVYWRPLWHMLEGRFELVLANAQHVKNVPGRKSDVNDAMWIADLLAHGLIRSSFVPPAPIQELRDLTRTRKQLVREICQHSLRIQKVLEDANLKLGSVLSDVLTASGRAMLGAIIDGESDPERLAELAQGSARRKRGALVEALRGRITPHHRTLLKLHLEVITALERTLGELDAAVGKALAPIQERARLLTTVPGGLLAIARPRSPVTTAGQFDASSRHRVARFLSLVGELGFEASELCLDPVEPSADASQARVDVERSSAASRWHSRGAIGGGAPQRVADGGDHLGHGGRLVSARCIALRDHEGNPPARAGLAPPRLSQPSRSLNWRRSLNSLEVTLPRRRAGGARGPGTCGSGRARCAPA